MPNLNQVNLIGNITRDVDTRYTPSGTAVVEVDLAINRAWKSDSGEKREETVFVNITLFGRTAEVAAKYCHKGDPLFVSGRLHLDTWDDKQTGQKRSKLRSEEHTSELQSHSDLVCRLLLEKKNKQTRYYTALMLRLDR